MRQVIAKELRKQAGLDKDPKNKVLKKLYRRLKKQYTQLNWLEKTEKNNERRSKK